MEEPEQKVEDDNNDGGSIGGESRGVSKTQSFVYGLHQYTIPTWKWYNHTQYTL